VASVGAAAIASLFRDANYRKIWATGMASGVSRWLEMLAAGIYGFAATGSPFLVALLVIARLIPLVALGLLVGTLADRLSPKRFMVAGMVLGTAMTTTVFVAFLLGLANYWLVLASAVVAGIVWSLDMPLRRRMIGDLAGKDRLVTALSFDSATNHSTRMIGPLVGGLLYEIFGPAGAYGLVAACYLIGLVNIARVEDKRPARRPGDERTSIASDFREALALAAGNKDILRILLVTVAFNVFALPFLAMIPVLGGETLGLSAGWVGVLAGLEGMGAFLGGIAIAMYNPQIGLRRFYFFGVALYLLCAFSAGFITFVAPMTLAVLGVGIGTSGFSSMQSTLTYSVAPPHMRSRLFGLIVICIGTGLFGVANMGLMAEWFGAPLAVRIVAVEGAFALLAIGLGWRELWNKQHA
jgi:MFS family permease